MRVLADTNVMIDYMKRPSDAIIAYIAINNEVPVWTNDAHFKLIQEVEKNLKLYNRK